MLLLMNTRAAYLWQRINLKMDSQWLACTESDVWSGIAVATPEAGAAFKQLHCRRRLHR